MFASIVLLATFCASVWCAPSPPTPVKQFNSNFTITFDKYAANATQLFKGKFVLDDVNGGGYLAIEGEEFVPLYLSTHFVAVPDSASNTITGYMYERDLCWNGGTVPKDFLQLFPLAIPSSAIFNGNKMVNGVNCEQWVWTTDSYDGVSGEITMSITSSGLIQRIVISKVEFVQTITWNFINMQKGISQPFKKPNVKCTSVFDNQQRQFMNPAKMITALSLMLL